MDIFDEIFGNETEEEIPEDRVTSPETVPIDVTGTSISWNSEEEKYLLKFDYVELGKGLSNKRTMTIEDITEVNIPELKKVIKECIAKDIVAERLQPEKETMKYKILREIGGMEFNVDVDKAREEYEEEIKEEYEEESEEESGEAEEEVSEKDEGSD